MYLLFSYKNDNEQFRKDRLQSTTNQFTFLFIRHNYTKFLIFINGETDSFIYCLTCTT